ncbi:hypothetical protein DBR43_00105 [Pedobacter sp. KBW06]|uniref:hypothetical protein n=1 Tax=Pedobacter sp. KBW06 TaxID=2153359 RepID=UPI000F5A3CC2|nr:hypothetical protein [Pedobacter sp. KBW06]RQO73848.1 hypothetical protein DBR43_00105 [Pedobacter sp. KBW06]
MNNLTIGALILIAIVVLPYLFLSFRKLSRHNMPFFKAFNPSYNLKRFEADELKKSLSPIITEMETKRVSNFINHWTAKFENNKLNVEDVKMLNELLATGKEDQVNGILALHPQAMAQYTAINKDLNPVVAEPENPHFEKSDSVY